MNNLAMKHKLQSGEALSVLKEGAELQEGVYELRRFVDGSDYCDPVREKWIWSIGQRFSDNRIFAACDCRFADNPNYSCLWLR